MPAIDGTGMVPCSAQTDNSARSGHGYGSAKSKVEYEFVYCLRLSVCVRCLPDVRPTPPPLRFGAVSLPNQPLAVQTWMDKTIHPNEPKTVKSGI